MGISRKKAFAEGRLRKENLNQNFGNGYKGRKQSEATKRLLRTALRKHSQKYRDWAIHLNEVLPARITRPEQLLIDEFAAREIGYYRRQKIPHVCVPDFTFPDQKVVVFADGDHWHGYEYPDEKMIGRNKTAKDMREKDERISRTLTEQGWLVLRYWEHEINSDAEGVVDEIEEIVLNRTAVI